MTTTSSDREARRRAAEREVARRWHPDLGGDAETYVAEMRRVAVEYGDTDGGENALVAEGFTRSRHWARVRKVARRAAREARGAVPSRWPGARKYGQL